MLSAISRSSSSVQCGFSRRTFGNSSSTSARRRRARTFAVGLSGSMPQRTRDGPTGHRPGVEVPREELAIDIASVRQQSAGLTQLWLRTTFIQRRRFLPSDAAPASYSLSRTELDCTERRFRISDLLWHDQKNSLLGSTPHDANAPWQYPPPTSGGEQLVSLCESPRLLDGTLHRTVTAAADSALAAYSERVSRCESARTEPAASLCRRWKAAKARPAVTVELVAALVDSVDAALGIVGNARARSQREKRTTAPFWDAVER